MQEPKVYTSLAHRMALIMKEVKSVKKGELVNITQSKSYTAVRHDDVAALLHNPLANYGVWVKVSVTDCQVSVIEKIYKNGDKGTEHRADVWVEVSFINTDNPQDRETVKSFAYAFDSGDKATGKAESMAVKYALLKNFTLESVDEEESRDYEKINYGQNNQTNQAPQNKPQQNNSTAPLASEAQKKAMKSMGISFPDNVTKAQASELIGQANKR